jgi:hypothetical protein
MQSSNSAGTMERAPYAEDDVAGEPGATTAYRDDSDAAQAAWLETLTAENMALKSENESLRAALEIARETMLRMLNHNNELLAGAISVLHERPDVFAARTNAVRPGRSELASESARKVRDAGDLSVAAECISAADLTEWL